jgi:hypothetical protein
MNRAMNGGTLRSSSTNSFNRKLVSLRASRSHSTVRWEIAFRTGINPLNQVGQTFDLFD